MSENFHVFGVRHHGPGSARSLVAALERLRPDTILVEGPPDAQEIVAIAAREGIDPPVALMIYAADDPQKAVFYPFASFSPEWQAIRFGLAHSVDIRFIDLPQSHRLAQTASAESPPLRTVRVDPLDYLARIAGYRDGERWWDHVVEARGDIDGSVFDAVLDAMTALREAEDDEHDVSTLLREAYMRQSMRAAARSGAQRIAVVCGAWHAPALRAMPAASRDAALLKGIPRIKTKAAWVPWSYDRLAFRSGYGAGIESPEWYDLLWQQRDQPVLHWMTRMARLLREHDIDASSAQVIEAVRLAEALAALRGRALPGIDELMEAALSVVCAGDQAPLRLIERKLVCGERLGQVPADLPLAPLQEDFTAQQKRLRLPISADHKDLDLDLRNDIDLARSRLFHRLTLIDIPWARPNKASVRSAGSFHEFWRLQWNPEFALALVDAARWGGTIHEAATARSIDKASRSEHVREAASLLELVLLAELPVAVERILSVLDDRAAASRDTVQLMEALPSLVRARRYGSVRQADASLLERMLDRMVARIAIGLGAACASMDDTAAADMVTALTNVDVALNTLQQDNCLGMWREALAALADHSGLHALIAGRIARLLLDSTSSSPQATATRMHLALSSASGAAAAARWVEGFLSDGGALLIHDDVLRGLVDDWLSRLTAEHYIEALPLLRRTFALLAPAERRQIGQRLKRSGSAPSGSTATTFDVDIDRANRVLPVLALLYPKEAS